jgi:hypothetical protein
MTDDELTEEERAAWRHIRFQILPSDGILGVQWRGIPSPHGLMWQVSLHFFRWRLCMTRMTFAAYRQHHLQLGPYRNA